MIIGSAATTSIRRPGGRFMVLIASSAEREGTGRVVGEVVGDVVGTVAASVAGRGEVVGAAARAGANKTDKPKMKNATARSIGKSTITPGGPALSWRRNRPSPRRRSGDSTGPG